MRSIAKGALASFIVVHVGIVGSGCLTRPVVHEQPTTKDNFTTNVPTGGVDKIDLLFDIDNSASMGDKQDYLKSAIPDLIKRLVQPNCVDEKDATKIVGQTDVNGDCAAGTPEFPPVHDMHIGVVSSALGPRLGYACDPADLTKVGGLLRHNDDQGHLLNRATDDEHPEPDLGPSNFLAWFPGVAANAGKAPGANTVPLTKVVALEDDFADLIAGVHQLGCGVESQLESWYRFLIQPDPYASLDNPMGKATWVGVDETIIRQRHDFLRPDSLVAVIVLSDENDSEIDVRALGQQGWKWMVSSTDDKLDFKPQRGTSQCVDPASPDCQSCAVGGNSKDPNCATAYTASNDWGYDLNLRHVHMKAKYGVDVQFPIQRYVNGLTSGTVPNRDGEYPAGKTSYVGMNNCTNPLFAAELPDGSNLDYNDHDGALCTLKPGARTSDLVFFAHIGGVPHELLHFDPNDADKSALTDADWEKILGHDPLKYDYTGIDPHMIESYAPRPKLAAPSSLDDADPVHGREWITDSQPRSVDLQYACTFPLPKPRDCTLADNSTICDCPASATSGLTHEQTPPVCGTNVTQQVRAKAYPTIREILLARLMGKQGVLSSICPIDVNDNADQNDPLYGYRPAVASIVDRLKNALTNQCLPQPLALDDQGNAPCLILEIMPDAKSTCDAALGLSDPPAEILQRFKDSIKTGKPGDPSLNTICRVRQLVGSDLQDGSCATSLAPGWCYVKGAAAGRCPQAILFSPSGNPPNGASVRLQCIEQFGNADAGAQGD